MSEDHDVVRLECPLRQHVHASGLYTFDKPLRLDPASLLTSPSSGYFPTLGDGLHHPLDVVVARRRLLPGDGAVDGIGHQEYSYLRRPLDQGQSKAKSVVRTLTPIGGIIDNQEILLACRFVHGCSPFLMLVPGLRRLRDARPGLLSSDHTPLLSSHLP